MYTASHGTVAIMAEEKMSLIHFGLFTDRYERLEQQYGNVRDGKKGSGSQLSCNT